MKTIVQVRDQSFVDERIDMTGIDFVSCRFDGCVLLLNRTPGVETIIDRCRFLDCQHLGDDWPDHLRKRPALT